MERCPSYFRGHRIIDAFPVLGQGDYLDLGRRPLTEHDLDVLALVDKQEAMGELDALYPGSMTEAEVRGARQKRKGDRQARVGLLVGSLGLGAALYGLLSFVWRH